MVFIAVFFIAPLLLGALAVRFGADSRDGRDWQPRDRYPRTAAATSLR